MIRTPTIEQLVHREELVEFALWEENQLIAPLREEVIAERCEAAGYEREEQS